jgi:hypothetical protein
LGKMKKKSFQKKPKRTSKIGQKQANRKRREEANESEGQSPKSRQQERNTTFIAAKCSLYRQKSRADQSKEAENTSNCGYYCSLYCSLYRAITRRRPSENT